MFNKMPYICENEYNSFFKFPNINGVGIGHKIINGIDTGIPCLTVMAIQKMPADQLAAHEMVPKEYKGIETDVVEVGEFTPCFNTSNKGYIRPVEGGYSGSYYNASGVGTLGGLISSGAGTGLTTYFLSNNHVLAGTNTATIGTAVIQPGVGDGPNTLTNQVGNLTAYIPIDFSPGNQNLTDSAIAQILSTTIAVPTIVDIGVPTGIASAVIGDFIQKSGRSDGYTTGTIVSINATVSVNYGGSFGNATFIQQITTTKMLIPGDSGSLGLDASNRIVGLGFATGTTTSSFNDIRNVLKAYRARVVG